MNDYLIFTCPHCQEPIQIFKNEMNCKIFRHAVYKNNFHNINPHAPKAVCDNLVNNNLVYGCAKPFRLVNNGSELVAEICEYI